MRGSAFRHRGSRPWMIGAAVVTAVVASLLVNSPSPSALATIGSPAVVSLELREVRLPSRHRLEISWDQLRKARGPGVMFFAALVR